MKTKAPRPSPDSTSPVAESFDEYVVAVEAGLDGDDRRTLDALRAHYSLASQLISLRKENKLTQTDLAQRAHVNQSDISRLERGSANLSQEALQRIADVFGARLGFIDAEGNPTS